MIFGLNHTLLTVAFGSASLGAVAGALGCFAVLRRQSLLGDAVSHAALPGIALAFILTQSKAPLTLFLGALIAGCLGAIIVMNVVATTRVKSDSALGIVLSVFFGAGLVLLTFSQRQPGASQAGLDRFLFGQAATLLNRDLWFMAIAGTVVIFALIVFWKEFKILSFDPVYAASLGMPVRTLEVLLTALIVAAIVLGLQTVGVVLMSALVVAPAAAARQWTNRLSTMVLLGALAGAVAGVLGALTSSTFERVPAGPAIVLFASIITIASFLFAPGRGLLWQSIAMRRRHNSLRADALLVNMLDMEWQHVLDNPEHAHSTRALKAAAQVTGVFDVKGSLENLTRRGLVTRLPGDRWKLTPIGTQHAAELTRGENIGGTPTP